MKKLFVPFFLIILILTQTVGCGVVGFVTESNSELVDNITKAFDKKDCKLLKSLFAEKITKSVDVDTQIEQAFDLYSSKSKKVTYEKCPTEEESASNGIVKKSTSDDFFVKTKDGTFYFYMELFSNDSDESENGLTLLCVQSGYNEDTFEYDKEVVIGTQSVNWLDK